MSPLRRVGLLLVAVGCLWSCKEKAPDTPTPLPDPGLTWQVHEDFLFDRKIQLASYADSAIIILSGNRTTAIAPDPDRRSTTDTTFVHFGGQAENNGRTDYRPLLHSTFFGFLYEGFVNLVPTTDPVLNYSNARLIMNQLDADFASFATLPVDMGETMAANQQNQFIVPYNVYDRRYATPVIDGNQTCLLLVSVTVPKAPYVALTIAKTQKIVLPASSGLRSVQRIGNNFIVSLSSGTYRIKPDGTYLKTYPYSLIRQFTTNETVYGLTNGGAGSLQLVASTDQGNTWQTIATDLPTNYSLLSYKQVQNQVIGVYNSQLFQLTITPTTLSTTELDNTGLYGNKITSVATYRNTVYVSTLSGVFTKPVRTFLTPKKS
ncbi:hypothetical protein [Fibrella forsythiae]|uniref:Lipoprotein n=1 Tax=Fibrella forsythiae TaxID=2817061 RepID=A0ABS3JNM4_9BACT|nr:hypothetical protein [Fibrella forsythiae]MBO0951605.1 hypothetical protein [Fibrella forsythiae]